MLNVGCGQGEPVLSIQEETTTAVGLDVSEGENSNVKIPTGSIQEWQWSGRSLARRPPHDQLERADFVVTDRICVGENLKCDEEEDEKELPWTLFEARVAE